MSDKVTLLIVDFQKDFCSPEGSLYVRNAPSALKHILSLLQSGEVDNAIFTVDWHPANHCSFKQNGGQWDMHCVQYSEGASIPNQLIETCVEANVPYQVIRKGTNSRYEAYSAFAEMKDDLSGCTVVSDSQEYRIAKDKPLVVCGLAGDYCVFESVKSLCFLHPSIYMEGIAFIGDETPFKEYMKEHDLQFYVR